MLNCRENPVAPLSSGDGASQASACRHCDAWAPGGPLGEHQGRYLQLVRKVLPAAAAATAAAAAAAAASAIHACTCPIRCHNECVVKVPVVGLFLLL